MDRKKTLTNLKHLKLYEEFNYRDGVEFAEKLRIYALASSITKKVSPLNRANTDLSFEIHTLTPSDNGRLTMYSVFVPMHAINGTKVITIVGGKPVRTDRVSPPNENDIRVMVTNFIEATNLYDDAVVTYIVDAYTALRCPEDVKAVIAKMDQ